MNALAIAALVGAMKRYSGTETLMAVAATAAFLFILGVTVVPRPEPGPATFDLASVSKLGGLP